MGVHRAPPVYGGAPNSLEKHTKKHIFFGRKKHRKRGVHFYHFFIRNFAFFSALRAKTHKKSIFIKLPHIKNRYLKNFQWGCTSGLFFFF